MESNKILCGNCLDLMKGFPSGMVDLTISSPPYDSLRKYEGFDFPFEDIAIELYRVSKVGGCVIWVVGDKVINGSESLTSFKQAIYFNQIGFNVHDTMLYVKKNPIPQNHNRYEQAFEYIFVLTKGKPKTFNPIKVEVKNKIKPRLDCHHMNNYVRGNSLRGHKADKIKNNIWEYSIGNGSSTKDKEAFEHPAIFPEQLVYDQVISWSNPGDLVFDPMCGSGTTCKVAYLLGRNYLGIDISEKYVSLAKRRIENVIRN